MPMLEKRLLRDVGRAIADFRLVEPSDRILVGVSGGKDSFTLLHLLQHLQRSAPIEFSLIACNLDQGHPGFPARELELYLRRTGAEVLMLREDTYSVVKRLVPEGKTTCSVCSRLRSDDGRNLVIRPLCYAAESEIAAFAAQMKFPLTPCELCGSQENLQRKRVKQLLSDLEREHPGVRASILGSMGNVMPEHLLDRRLIREERGPDPWIDGDGCESPQPIALR